MRFKDSSEACILSFVIFGGILAILSLPCATATDRSDSIALIIRLSIGDTVDAHAYLALALSANLTGRGNMFTLHRIVAVTYVVRGENVWAGGN